jgi:hypothetical protein
MAVPRTGPLALESVSSQHVAKLPPGCFDTIDGYLDPKSYIIRSYENGDEVRRPDVQERQWITQNCRMGLELSQEVDINLPIDTQEAIDLSTSSASILDDTPLSNDIVIERSNESNPDSNNVTVNPQENVSQEKLVSDSSQ